MLESRDNVKVAIRIRPLNAKEQREMDSRKCVTAHAAENAVEVALKPEARLFTYDFVADEDASQEQVFDAVGAPVATACLSGYNCTIFAYGQTGAGKTYTILGPDLGTSFDGPEHDVRGLLPRCAEYLFSSIAREAHAGEVEYLVKCSYLEIYQETIIDLLDPSGEARPLHLHEDIKRGVYVDGLIEETILDVSAAYELILAGNRYRHVGATSMNKESSRSHTVFTIMLESKDTRSGALNFRSSNFHLIDLAGSERQKATDTAGERLKEAGKINKSLSALGNVINSLVDIAEGKNRHVHYRDSKLTFLLKDSLGGNAKTLIIANISPAAAAFGETLSTLKFVQRAKQIRNKAHINEDTSGSVEALKEELRRVKELLNQGQALCPRCASGESAGSNGRKQELEKLLERSLRLRQASETLLQAEIAKRDNRVSSLESLMSGYEERLAQSESLLKLRSSSRLSPRSPGAADPELTLLREMLENNPEAARLQAENDSLRSKVQQMMAEGKHDPSSVLFLVRENQDFTQELADTLSATVKEREELHMLLDRYERETHENVELAELKATYEERIMTLEEQLAAERADKAHITEKLTRKAELQARRIETLSAKLAGLDVPFSPSNTEGSFDLLDAFTPARKSLLTPLSPMGTVDLPAEDGKVKTLEAEITELKDMLEQKESELREFREELEIMSAAGEFIKLQVRECSQRAEEKTSQNLALEKELREVKAAAAAQAELLRTSKEHALQLALQEGEKLRKEKAEVEIKVEEKATAIGALEEKCKDLREALELSTAQERLANSTVLDLQKKVLALTQTLSGKADALESVQAELQFYQQENHRLVASDSPAEVQRLQQEIERLLSEKEAEVAVWRQRASEAEEKANSLPANSTDQQTVDTLRAQLMSLRGSLTQSQALNKALTETVAALRSELAVDHSQTSDSLALAEELHYLREENHALKQEISVKVEILNNTNRNILATRSEIEQWKVTIEDKNSVIRSLKGELKEKETSFAVVQQSCGEQLSELQAALATKEMELKVLKEHSAKRICRAEASLEKQRREVELIAKQGELQRLELDRCREELRSAKRDREELAAQLEQVASDKKSLRRATSPHVNTSPSGSEKLREELRRLNTALARISDFVLSLPIGKHDPEETDVVEGTIRRIAGLYEMLETRELELSDKERELQRKQAKLSLLENEKSLWRQRLHLSP